MKYNIYFLFVVLQILLLTPTQGQTNIASPENVLVVYNGSDNTSSTIANYYKNARNIPAENVYPLYLPSSYLIGDKYVHLIDHNEVLILGNGNSTTDPNSIYNNTMQYVKTFITQPIEDYLNNTFINGVSLAEKIRFIVVCKGIPIKATSWVVDHSHINDLSRRGVSVNALISIINQSDPTFSITNSSFISSGYITNTFSNPYHAIENLDGTDYNFSYRFKTKTYINSSGIELNYLVSRLDGYNYDDVIALIDRSIDSDKSGQSVIVLDGDATSYTGKDVSACRTDVNLANQKLIGLNFLTEENVSDSVILGTSDNCIGYESSGSHSDALLYADYCVDVLSFNYSNGAIFNTYESFNGYAFDSINLGDNQNTFGKRQGHNFNPPSGPIHYQGLIADFIHAGGTGGESHVYEPTTQTVSDGEYLFPSYAMGYSLVEAIYMGIPYLAYRNLVIGDPLTTIAWGKQTLTSDLNWSGSNLVTGEIDISDLKTLTVANNSIINLRHQGFITGEGKLILGQNVTFNLYSWDKGLFLSYDSDNPRLVWGAHPTLGSGANYRVYRKLGSNASWVLITTTTSKEYKDLEMQFSEIGDQLDNLFYKVVAFSELPGTYESNIVACTGNKAPKKIKANQNLNSPVEYSLEQNYPNPFNPTTQINYSIKEAGLVQLKVYDILGKEIATLVNENKEAGNYSIGFNAAELPSGVYIYQLTTPGFSQVRKMILAK